jgi:pyruvate dehydrogenase phosphatase
VTRAIGDVYLKHNEFNRDPLPARFKQEHPIVRPVLKAEPTVQAYQLGPDDRFVIFASDGLWDEIENDQAITIVKYNSRSVSVPSRTHPPQHAHIYFFFVVFGFMCLLVSVENYF